MNKAKDTMRRDWDERARRDAFHYIASWRTDWDEASFFESGEQDYLRLVHPILRKIQFDSANKAMAEVGCGAGRMTRSFAQRFLSVFAVDISAEMQSRAKQYLGSFSNIRWILSNGETLSDLQSASVDFVFSYLVLQHMPTKEIVFGSIREMLRILRPGGAFLFQFNGSHGPTMNWKGRAISGILDSMASRGLNGRVGASPDSLESIPRWWVRPGAALLLPPKKLRKPFVPARAYRKISLVQARRWHGAMAASCQRPVCDHSWPELFPNARLFRLHCPRRGAPFRGGRGAHQQDQA